MPLSDGWIRKEQEHTPGRELGRGRDQDLRSTRLWFVRSTLPDLDRDLFLAELRQERVARLWMSARDHRAAEIC